MGSDVIGIIVGCVIGALCLLGIGFYWFRLNDTDRKNKDTRMLWKLQHRKSLKGNFIMTYTTPIEDAYDIDQNLVLGKGSFGVVVVGTNVENGLDFAIKIVNKSTGKTGRLERELKLLKDVDHPNIVRLFAAYDTPEQLGFVMEMCTGGHIGVIAEGSSIRVSESKAKSFVRQLLSAVAHMHSRGICHRDIKLQNILLEDTKPNAQIKLIDFGFGTRFVGALPLKTRCGTLYTTAPEVFRQSYDQRCDVWSCGVVAFILLCGKRPFSPPEGHKQTGQVGKDAVIKNILNNKYSFKHPNWRSVSTGAQKFIDQMLAADYRTRWHASEALEHDWLNSDNNTGSAKLDGESAKRGSGKLSSAQGNRSFDLGDIEQVAVQKAVLNMRRNSLMSTLHQTSMVAVAYALPQCKMEESRAIFQSFDTDHNGALDRAEFRFAISACSQLYNKDGNGGAPLSDADIDRLFDTIDVNNDGQISFTEFLAATLDPKDINVEALKSVFELMDREKKGYITTEDMMRVLSVGSKLKATRRKSYSAVRTSQTMIQPIRADERNLANGEEGSPARRSSFSNILRRPSQLLNMSPLGPSPSGSRRPSWNNVLENAKGLLTLQPEVQLGSSQDNSDMENSLTMNNKDKKQPPKSSQKKPNNAQARRNSAPINGAKSSPALLAHINPAHLGHGADVDDDNELDPELKERVKRMMKRCDVDGKGVITYAAFLWAMADGDSLINSNKENVEGADDDMIPGQLRRVISCPSIPKDMQQAALSSPPLTSENRKSGIKTAKSLPNEQLDVTNISSPAVLETPKGRRKSCLDTTVNPVIDTSSLKSFAASMTPSSPTHGGTSLQQQLIAQQTALEEKQQEHEHEHHDDDSSDEELEHHNGVAEQQQKEEQSVHAPLPVPTSNSNPLLPNPLNRGASISTIDDRDESGFHFDMMQNILSFNNNGQPHFLDSTTASITNYDDSIRARPSSEMSETQTSVSRRSSLQSNFDSIGNLVSSRDRESHDVHDDEKPTDDGHASSHRPLNSSTNNTTTTTNSKKVIPVNIPTDNNKHTDCKPFQSTGPVHQPPKHAKQAKETPVGAYKNISDCSVGDIYGEVMPDEEAQGKPAVLKKSDSVIKSNENHSSGSLADTITKVAESLAQKWIWGGTKSTLANTKPNAITPAEDKQAPSKLTALASPNNPHVGLHTYAALGNSSKFDVSDCSVGELYGEKLEHEEVEEKERSGHSGRRNQTKTIAEKEAEGNGIDDSSTVSAERDRRIFPLSLSMPAFLSTSFLFKKNNKVGMKILPVTDIEKGGDEVIIASGRDKSGGNNASGGGQQPDPAVLMEAGILQQHKQHSRNNMMVTEGEA